MRHPLAAWLPRGKLGRQEPLPWPSQVCWDCCGQHFCCLPLSLAWRPLAASKVSLQFSTSTANSQPGPYGCMSDMRGKQGPGRE